MAKTFRAGGSAIDKIVTAVMNTYHTSLAKHKVRFRTLIVRQIDEEGDPVDVQVLRKGGNLCLATIKVCTPKDRVLMETDLVLTIDGFMWDHLSEGQRHALMDHELEHILIDTDKDGITKTHPDGAAKLISQPDDWATTGFQSVLERHGTDSIEYLGMVNAANRLPEQLYFAFTADTKIIKGGKSRRKAADG